MRLHPNSGRLRICRVDTGREVVQVVSGASNLAPGANVPYARPGTVLPSGGHDTVGVRQILGERSEGVLCSGADLCTEEWGFGDALGVLILDPGLQPGAGMVEALGLHDRILEFELTPNRGDCLAVLNIAREVRALTGDLGPGVRGAHRGPDQCPDRGAGAVSPLCLPDRPQR